MRLAGLDPVRLNGVYGVSARAGALCAKAKPLPPSRHITGAADWSDRLEQPTGIAPLIVMIALSPPGQLSDQIVANVGP